MNTSALLAACVALLAAPLAPAQVQSWSPLLHFGDDFFPSFAISTATLRLPKQPSGNTRGDPSGAFGITVTVTQPTVLVAEISCKKFISKSGLKVNLTKPGTYVIQPTLNYDFDALYSVTEAEPTQIAFRLLDSEGKQLGATTKRILVRSINECVIGMKTGNHVVPLHFLFAAYVNENHPLVDKITQQALKQKLIGQFIGYQGTNQDVYKQVAAIWTVFQRMGLKYSSMTTTAGSSEVVASQRVRFFDDSVKNTQANCVDGSVLMASVFRAIGLKPFLVIKPGHCYLGVIENEKANSAFEIETTMIGSGATLDQAIKRGSTNFAQDQPRVGKTFGYYVIDIAKARDMGVQPLRSKRAQVASQ